MNKKFNTDGYCDPKIHYMVDLSSRLAEIKSMVDDGKYFTINKARQSVMLILQPNKALLLLFPANY